MLFFPFKMCVPYFMFRHTHRPEKTNISSLHPVILCPLLSFFCFGACLCSGFVKQLKEIGAISKIGLSHSYFFCACLKTYFHVELNLCKMTRHCITFLVRSIGWWDESHPEGVQPYWSNVPCPRVFKSYAENYIEILCFWNSVLRKDLTTFLVTILMQPMHPSSFILPITILQQLQLKNVIVYCKLLSLPFLMATSPLTYLQ